MEYTVINYLFDKGETVSEGICFTSQSKVTGLIPRHSPQPAEQDNPCFLHVHLFESQFSLQLQRMILRSLSGAAGNSVLIGFVTCSVLYMQNLTDRKE